MTDPQQATLDFLRHENPSYEVFTYEKPGRLLFDIRKLRPSGRYVTEAILLVADDGKVIQAEGG